LHERAAKSQVCRFALVSGGAAPLFSLALPLDAPVDVIAERAQTAERLGFDRVWVPDERLRRSVYVALAACALKTESIGLGVGVTNPYTRHAAVTAASIASVEELRPGKVVLGLGAGGELSHLGIAPDLAHRHAHGALGTGAAGLGPKALRDPAHSQRALGERGRLADRSRRNVPRDRERSAWHQAPSEVVAGPVAEPGAGRDLNAPKLYSSPASGWRP
jgi:hypothetical protein